MPRAMNPWKSRPGNSSRCSARGLQAGAAAKAVLRPETIELVGADAGGAPATILTRTYLGEKVEYMVECLGERLLVTRHGGAFAVGDRVSLRLPQQDLAVLA